jgi:hypothetical protein
VLRATGKGNNATMACDSVIVVFIPLWKSISCIYVECNTTFCYAYVTVAVGNGRKLQLVTPKDTVCGIVKEEGDFSSFQGIQCSMFIKL